MTTITTHTIQCDRPGCVSIYSSTDQALRAAVLEVNVRKLFAADAIGAGWGCDNGSAISAKATIGDTFDRLKWTCPACATSEDNNHARAIVRDIARGLTSSQIRDEIIQQVGMMASARTPEMNARYKAALEREGKQDSPAGPVLKAPDAATAAAPNTPHSYRCSCFRGSTAAWGPMEDCTCGLRQTGRAIVLGMQISAWGTTSWHDATVTAPPTQFGDGGVEFEACVGGSRVPTRIKVADFGTRWRFAPTEADTRDPRFLDIVKHHERLCALLAIVPGPATSWDAVAEALRLQNERIEKHRDRLTALLALDNWTSWENIVAAIEQLRQPNGALHPRSPPVSIGTDPAAQTGWFGADPRARDIAWAAWSAAHTEYAPFPRGSIEDVDASFAKWFEWKDKHL